MNAVAPITPLTLFFPPAAQQESKEITFNDAIRDLNVQRIARIAKTIFFTISSIATTVALILTEASIFATWMAIPAFLTVLVAGAIFYRLNSLDSRYVERLTDATRESCIKNELERIFLSQEKFTPEEVTKSLNSVNRLLKFDVFDKEAIDNILSIQQNADVNDANLKSIAEMAKEQNQSIAVALGSDWFEQGRFGLPSYNLSVGVNWNGIPTDPIVVKYQSKEAGKNTEADEAILAT